MTAMIDEMVKKRSSTGVNVPPPPRSRRGLISPIPASTETPDNLSVPSSGLQDLNFKVDPVLHRAFKTVATYRGMSMKELLEASFRCWIKEYSDEEMTNLQPVRKLLAVKE